MEWEPVIGLEVHAQLNTNTKIFSGAATAYGAEPNTQACLIDLGMPGVLPVLNEMVVNMAIKFGLAIDAHINKTSIFARKNYFYPDLPKGYQISQYEIPIIGKGQITIHVNGETKNIGITRAHLEEDAGKSTHDLFDGYSAIDLNRAGTPLLEIVSEPELRSSKEAVAYLKQLHSIVTYLEICNGNMQEGSFRVDANVSVRPVGTTKFGTRTEIKNINSFKFVELAIQHEIARQIDLLENNQEIVQETRLYDSSKNETRSMRSKEEAHDYRYFPDPDLLPVVVDDNTIDELKSSMPELPQQKHSRFMQTYHLNDYDAGVLVSDKQLSNFYEDTVSKSKAEPKIVANWILSELLSYLNKFNCNINNCPINTTNMAQLLDKIHDQTINGKIAKTVFEKMWTTTKTAIEIITAENLEQIHDDSAVEQIITEVLQQNSSKVIEYNAGKDKLFGFFVGQVMKASKGKANPQQVNSLLIKMLKQANN